MEIYKGTATFSGIAIGKILYYSRGEYQIRQCLVSNIKKEISNLKTVISKKQRNWYYKYANFSAFLHVFKLV